MLTAIPSQHKSIESLDASFIESLSSKHIEFDTTLVPPSIERSWSIEQLDTIDNPSFFIEPTETEKSIFKQMKHERNRLYSFRNKWPLRDISPENLAEAGLFYLQHEDKVQCPFCYVIISNWVYGDNPLREHMKRRPKCPFLTGGIVGNVPLVPTKHQKDVSNETSNPFLNGPEKSCLSHSISTPYKPKHPRMADAKRRILTFSGWPLSRPTPQQLVESGLYYSGIHDVVTCFFCGGTLGNWDLDDDPWCEHKKFFPDCAFLLVSRNSGQVSKSSPPPEKESIESHGVPVTMQPSDDITSDIIEEAQGIFPQNLVLEAVKRKDGRMLSLQELCDDILELNQNKKEENNEVKFEDKQEENGESLGNAASNDVLLCKVCMDREKGAVFQPCGHFVSCWRCANMVANCPVCRRPITHKIRTYIS